MKCAYLAIVLLLGLAGCGGDDDEGGGGGGSGGGSGGGQTVSLSADPGGGLEFDPTELTAKAGSVTIAFDNPAGVPHAVAIEGADAKSPAVTESATEVTADLEAGSYTFFCPVGTHRQSGMEGTLTVE